jgi:hypothetical protein
MADTSDCEYAALIRSLAASQRAAAQLGLTLTADLLAAASLDVALQWTGGRGELSDPAGRLDQLLRLRIVQAHASSDGAIVPIFPRAVKHPQPP